MTELQTLTKNKNMKYLLIVALFFSVGCKRFYVLQQIECDLIGGGCIMQTAVYDRKNEQFGRPMRYAAYQFPLPVNADTGHKSETLRIANHICDSLNKLSQ